jgi:hypothetical protein
MIVRLRRLWRKSKQEPGQPQEKKWVLAIVAGNGRPFADLNIILI